MPTRPKGPWLWRGRGYYFWLNDKRINLRTKNLDEAWHKYHQIMADERLPSEARPVDRVSVHEIVDRFGQWAGKNLKPTSAQHYDAFIVDFLRRCESFKAMDAMDLRPFHVQGWIDAREGWNQTTRKLAAGALKRAFSWATKQGLIPANPIQPLTMPKAKRRLRILDDAEWQAVMKACDGHEPLRDVLKFQRETGARPQEIRAAEIRHFDRRGGCLRFPPDEAKGGIARVIVLTKTAQEIAKGCIGERDEGHVFLNANGDPWTRHSLHTALRHLQARCKVKLDAYTGRHSYATDALTNGVDGVTVGVLMGHVDPSMIAKVYQHLDQKPDYLRKAAEKAVTRDSGSARKGGRGRKKAAKPMQQPEPRPQHPARSRPKADPQ